MPGEFAITLVHPWYSRSSPVLAPYPLRSPLSFSVMVSVARQPVMFLEKKAYLPSIWHDLLLIAGAFRSEFEVSHLPPSLPPSGFQAPGLQGR